MMNYRCASVYVTYSILFCSSHLNAITVKTHSDEISYKSINFLKLGQPDANHVHEAIIAVKQNNLDKISSILNDISDKNSKNYGKFLNFEEDREILIYRMSTLETAMISVVIYIFVMYYVQLIDIIRSFQTESHLSVFVSFHRELLATQSILVDHVTRCYKIVHKSICM